MASSGTYIPAELIIIIFFKIIMIFVNTFQMGPLLSRKLSQPLTVSSNLIVSQLTLFCSLMETRNIYIQRVCSGRGGGGGGWLRDSC